MLLNNILDILHKYRRKNWIFLRMPPVRGRELKHFTGILRIEKFYDAPCAGARIETMVMAGKYKIEKMPPVRGRELKLYNFHTRGLHILMPPVRGRELKRCCICQRTL